MANYQNLMAAISAVIKTNNRREITGQILQNVLNEMVGSLGENMQLTGFANPLTNPGTPDQNVFYFATQAGIYHHFDDIELDDGFSVLMWKNGQWTANTLEIAVTRQWVQNNFVSIEFFRKMFRAYTSGGAEVVPNDVQGVIDNIKAMCGMWTEQYLSALGLDHGGGGGLGARYLTDLLDVTITNVQNGQALIYNSTLQQWVNGTAGVDMATVWSNLAGATSEQINISHLTGALSGYATTESLTQQINSTKTWVTSNFITIAYFDRLFRAYNNSTLVSHNDTTTTIDNIKAMFGFWTDFYLSALGTGGVSSVSISLSQLADVTLTSPTGGQALVYDAINNKWVNGTIQTGVSSLSDLSDVQLTAPATNQVLMYNASTTKWYNSALKTINGQPLYGSGDISVGGGASGNYLPLSGGTLTGSFYISLNNSDWSSIMTNNNIQIGLAHGAGYGFTINSKLINSNKYLFTVNYNQTYLGSGGNCAFVVGDSGLIGVNTPSPNFLLHITKNADVWHTVIEGVNGNTLRLCGGTAVGCAVINSYNSSVQQSNLIIQRDGGNLGIGLEYPNYILDIYSSKQEWCGHIFVSNVGKSSCFLGHGGGYGIWCGVSTTDYNHYILSLNNGMTGDGSGGSNILSVYANGQMNLNGSFYATGAVTALSDIRHKTVIKDAAVSVEDIARMPAVMYQWNDGREDKELHVGSIAQNWQTVLPEVVLKANDKEGTLSMQYGVAALVSSIIIARKVVNHEDRIKQLEKENKELKKRLNIA